MFNKEQMDERQLWVRGNVFQHSLFFAMGLLVANAFVQDFWGHWAIGRYESFILLFIIVAYTSLELIIKEVYVIQPKTQHVMAIIMGGCGLVLVGLGIMHLTVDGLPFAEGRMLTDAGCSILMGILILFIPVALLIKTATTPKQAEEEDE